MRFNTLEDRVTVICASLTFLGPGASRMNDIPIGTCLLVTAFSGVMVTEPIQGGVPQWSVQFDQCRLYRADHVGGITLENHETAFEIAELKSSWV
jgi:hypothetical protein